MILGTSHNCDTKVEGSSGFVDIADPGDIFPDLRLYADRNTEVHKLRDFNVLEHSIASVLRNTWHGRPPNVRFVLLDRGLWNHTKWFEQLRDAVYSDLFCCPVKAFGLSHGQCSRVCKLPKLPFVVKYKSTRLPDDTGYGTMAQYIFTYCFLSPEISSLVTIQNISHSIQGDVYSKVGIFRNTPELDSIDIFLFADGRNRKSIQLLRKNTIKQQWPVGLPWSLRFSCFQLLRLRHDQLESQPIDVPNFPVSFAQYKCRRCLSYPSAEDVTNIVKMEIGRNRETSEVELYVDIAVNDWNSYGTYECLVRFQSDPTLENRTSYVIHLNTIEITPVCSNFINMTSMFFDSVISGFKDLLEEPPTFTVDDYRYLRDVLYDEATSLQDGNGITHMYVNAQMKGQQYQAVTVAVSLLLVVVLAVILTLSMICWIRKRTAAPVHREAPGILTHTKTRETSQNSQLTYDVFLSYSSVDRLWVEKKLLYKLEMEGYKVCYDQRHEDFPAGKPIVASIGKAILNSRKTVAVFSPDYLSSDWAKYELDMVYTGINDGDIASDSLVVVKYRPCEIPLHLRRTTYNDWVHPNIRGTFWEKIYASLPCFLVQRFPGTLSDDEKKLNFWKGLFKNIGEPQKCTSGDSEEVSNAI